MFGRPHDIDGTDTLDANGLNGFFGDEAATANAVEIVELHQRIERVESQITSQFTSLATYAQIAQEQIEVARAEARSFTDRAEQRMTSLIERERADRISTFTGEAPAGSAPDVAFRLDALERSAAQIRQGLHDCLDQQKALADTITMLFERFAPSPLAPPSRPARSTFAPPEVSLVSSPSEPRTGGPIAGLSFDD